MASWQLLRKNWFGSRWDLVDETGSRQAEYLRSYLKPQRVLTPEGEYLITFRNSHDSNSDSARRGMTVQGPGGSVLEWEAVQSARRINMMVRPTPMSVAAWEGQKAAISFLDVMDHSTRVGLSVDGKPTAIALCVRFGGPRKIDFVDGLDPMLLHSFCSLTVFL